MKAGVVHAKEDIRYEEVITPEPKAGGSFNSSEIYRYMWF